MNNTAAFIQKLSELRELARKNGNALSEDEIESFAADANLSEDQVRPVLRYLQEEGIAVLPKASGKTGDGADSGDWDENGEPEDFLAGYLDQIREMPKLEPQEELLLFQRTAQGDMAARDALAAAYLEVVCDLAAEYQEESIPAEDLIAEGNLGLLSALNSFEAGESLAACQALLINALNEHLKSAAERLREEKRSDNAFVSRARHLDEARKTLEEELEHEVSPQELSAFLDLPLEEIEDVIRLFRKG